MSYAVGFGIVAMIVLLVWFISRDVSENPQGVADPRAGTEVFEIGEVAHTPRSRRLRRIHRRAAPTTRSGSPVPSTTNRCAAKTPSTHWNTVRSGSRTNPTSTPLRSSALRHMAADPRSSSARTPAWTVRSCCRRGDGSCDSTVLMMR